MAAEEIFHTGRIVEITPDYTTVEIVSSPACSACHAAGFCGISGPARKAVQVPTSGISHEVGDEVCVALRRSMGFKAVWLAYAIPLAVLLAVLLGLLGLGLTELTAGLAALGAVALYYAGLWLLRDRLSNEYSFYIKGR